MFRERVERWRSSLGILFLVAATIYLTGVISPPYLMDDVDAVEAQIASTMLSSGDWVTARIDGVRYFEKSPLGFWLTAISFRVFGVHDWAARIPIALSAVALALVTACFGRWAFGRIAGFRAGLVLATCVGLWLFTRILIPDVVLTLTIALSMWAFLRVLDEQEKHPMVWACILSASLAAGLLLKSLVGVVFPIATAVIYLLFTRELLKVSTWKRLFPLRAIVVFLAVAAPWHILATLRNPPSFEWTLISEPGHYRGFLWFYVINEQLLRFLNMRYPRDYNTVPRLWFWLLHLLWLFPWGFYLPSAARLSFKPVDRGGRTRLLALCWIAFVLGFFTFSTTQEYYSMPCYPAFALLLGCAMSSEKGRNRVSEKLLAVTCALAAVTCIGIVIYVWKLPTPLDITSALTRHPKAYSLSLGHMQDLTLDSFAYLRLPLAIAAVAFLIGTLNGFVRAPHALLGALMMIVFFQAARIALIRFDPLLSSHGLAQSIMHDPPGQIILDHHYYTYSSVPFYTGATKLLLLNGRWNNFEYGANAPGAPDVFINDANLCVLWSNPERYYLVTNKDQLPRIYHALGANDLTVIDDGGGKVVLTNKPIVGPTPTPLPLRQSGAKEPGCN